MADYEFPYVKTRAERDEEIRREINAEVLVSLVSAFVGTVSVLGCGYLMIKASMAYTDWREKHGKL